MRCLDKTSRIHLFTPLLCKGFILYYTQINNQVCLLSLQLRLIAVSLSGVSIYNLPKCSCRRFMLPSAISFGSSRTKVIPSTGDNPFLNSKSLRSLMLTRLSLCLPYKQFFKPISRQVSYSYPVYPFFFSCSFSKYSSQFFMISTSFLLPYENLFGSLPIGLFLNFFLLPL